MGGQHIVAIGGGNLREAHGLVGYIRSLANEPFPRICTLSTASGDNESYIVAGYEVFPSKRWRTSHLRLFDRGVRDLRAALLAQDVIFVGGGNTANMLAIWRAHGVDEVLREAWNEGVVLTGVSAGAICWFECAVTDSFGGIEPLEDGVGILAGSACAHYDGDPQRRLTYHRLVRERFPDGYAIEDDVALHFVGATVHEAVSTRPGARAYTVRRVGEQVAEEPLPTRLV
jgi:dipeptidase E